MNKQNALLICNEQENPSVEDNCKLNCKNSGYGKVNNYFDFIVLIPFNWYQHLKNVLFKSTRLIQLLSLCTFFFCSCSDNSKEDEIRVIDPRELIQANIQLSDLAESISYIPLSNDITFGGIGHLQLCDSVTIACTYPEGWILAFNQKGKLLNRIGRDGRGPGEYQWAHMFTLDRENKRVYVQVKTKILKFSFDGSFLGDIPINCAERNFDEIVYFDDKLYLYEGVNLGYGKYNWVVIDTLGTVLSEKYNTVEKFRSTQYLLGNKQEAFNGQTYYWNVINDTIFRIEKDKITPEYLFAQGDFRFPKIWKIDCSEYFYPQKIFFTKNFLYTSFYYKSYFHTGIYDKKKNQFFDINKTNDKELYLGPGILNDMDMGMPLIPTSYYCDKENNEYLIGPVNAVELKAHCKTQSFLTSRPKYPEKKKELEKLANSLNDNDNEVLMVVKLKE